MTLEFHALHEQFGVEIAGVDITSMSDEVFAQVEAAAEEHSLVLFRDQSLDDERQLALTRRFGEPEFSHVAYGRDGSIEYIGVIGNIAPDGTQLPASDKKVVFGTGNEMWHSDSSFRPVPTRFSLSYAYEVTPSGGEIEFVSTRPAYAALPDAMKARIDDLVVVHDYVFSRSKVGEDVVSPSLAKSLPPVRQKLVRTNPVTGHKNFYVGSHAKTIEGWRDEDARELLDDLIARAVGPRSIYRHHWRAGDLLIWDNRCLLHRGRPYDADRYRRRMHQTRVVGVPTLDEQVGAVRAS